MSRRWLRSIAWIAGLVAIGAALRFAAVGDLGPPPVTSIGEWGRWIDGRPPGAAAIALVRFGAEWVTWYLLGLSTLHGVAAVAGGGASRRLADTLAIPGAGRLVRAALGLGLVAASAAGTPARPTPTAPATWSATARPAADDGAGTASMRPIPRDTPPGGTAWMRPSSVATAPAPEVATPAPPATWSVTAGESLWTIADELLRAQLGRAVADAEIDPYWRRLVDANRHRLVDPDDADLIVPGQVLEIPPLDVG